MSRSMTDRQTSQFYSSPPVCVAVDSPQLDVGAGLDGGGPRRAVDESQLAETAALRDGRHHRVVNVYLPERTDERSAHR